jgi:hypothetical protein
LEKILPYPDLFEQIDQMMQLVLIEIIPEQELILYLKDILFRISHQNQFGNIEQDELYFLRTLCYITYDNKSQENQLLPHIKSALESFFPSGMLYN